MSVLAQIVSEINGVLEQIDEAGILKLAYSLTMAKRIFVVGEGRSGLMAKAFAMRLMHLGAAVYVVGETITPALAKEDLLIGVSGSGKTEMVVRFTQKAMEIGAATYAITTNSSSPLAGAAMHVLVVPAATKHRNQGEKETIQPLGSQFDQAVHITLDAVCLLYANLRQEDSQIVLGRHSNLE